MDSILNASSVKPGSAISVGFGVQLQAAHTRFVLTVSIIHTMESGRKIRG